MTNSIDSSSSVSQTSTAQQLSKPPTESTFTEAGQNLQDIANEHGIPLDDLIKSNDQISNPWLVPAGSFVNIPAQAANDADNNSSQTPASAVAGAPAAREATIGAFQQRAYNAGANAPQANFNGDIFRSGGTGHIDGTFDTTRGGRGIAPGRFNAPGQAMIYTSPSAAENIGEMTAYKPNMAGNSMLESNLNLTVDKNGRGGLADIGSGLKQQGISESALTVPKGAQEIPPLYKALGEHPYTLAQQVGKGATDAGAAAIKSPSATGGSQIDLIPRNTDPTSITPRSIVDYDASGNPSAARSAATVKAMPPEATTLKPGLAEGAPRGGNNISYGAVGGAAVSLISDGVRAARGENVTGLDVAGNATLAAGTGATAVKATEALAPKMGLTKAGGAVGAVLEGGVSTFNNAALYKEHKITAAQATANVAVDTTVGLGSGLAGAAAGAAVGSIIPIAGTAVGAVVGFGVGVGAAYAVHLAGEASGAISGAKEWLGDELSGSEATLAKGWDKISSGVDSIKSTASDIKNGAVSGLQSAWSWATGN